VLNIKIHEQNHLVVIDFETCDTSPNAQVLTMGATLFNPTTISSVDELSRNTFYAEFKEQKNRTLSIDTLAWWMQQTRKAQQTAFEGLHKIQPAEILTNFNKWLQDKKATHLVGNGASFDNPILSSLYRQYDIKPTLPFWCDLDLRTMKWLEGGDKPKWPAGLIAHNAAHDAIYEAMQFQHIYKTLNT